MTLTKIADDLKQIEDKYSVLYAESIEGLTGWTKGNSPHYVYVYVQEMERLEDSVQSSFSRVMIMYKGEYLNVGRFEIEVSRPEERN